LIIIEHISTQLCKPHIPWKEHRFCQEFKYVCPSCTLLTTFIESYVYWTVHHLDCWVKRDQLDVTCFIISLFNAQHVSDVNTSILRSLRLMCWLISWVVLVWFDVCWCYVVVWPYHNVTPTHIEPDQYNPRNNSAHKSQAPEDGCINIWNMLSIK